MELKIHGTLIHVLHDDIIIITMCHLIAVLYDDTIVRAVLIDLLMTLLL